MFENLVKMLISFLIGIFVGACGKYYADKNTDKRRAKEKETNVKKIFKKLKEDMPALIKEMQEDVNKEKFVRDVFLLRRKNILNTKTKHFQYYEDEHDELLNKFKILENYDFVVYELTANTIKYKLQEIFVKLLKGEKIKIFIH